MTATRSARLRPLLAISLSGAALAACSHGGGGLSEATAPPEPALVQAISNDQQMGDVIDALNRGDTKSATKKLKTMLKRDPSDMRAKELLDSIKGDPKALLGSRSFAYTVRRGDTLRDLAGRYLDDADKFYVLARYNDIAVPESVEAGQTLRIPGTAPKRKPKPARPEPKPAPAKPEPKPAKPEPAAPKPAKPSADPARAARYRAAGLNALNQGKVDRAVGLLARAAQLDPGNSVIERDLARARRIRRTVHARQ